MVCGVPCDCARILCCITFRMLCYCAFSAPMSVICWLSVHGSVCLFERVFPVCCLLSVLGLLRM